MPSTHPNGSHVVTVEVDVESGKVHILRYIAVEDSGHLITPLLVKGQIQGGVAQAIGSALYERLVLGDDQSGPDRHARRLRHACRARGAGGGDGTLREPLAAHARRLGEKSHLRRGWRIRGAGSPACAAAAS